MKILKLNNKKKIMHAGTTRTLNRSQKHLKHRTLETYSFKWDCVAVNKSKTYSHTSFLCAWPIRRYWLPWQLGKILSSMEWKFLGTVLVIFTSP